MRETVILRIDDGIVSLESGEEYLNRADIELEVRDYDCEGIEESHLKVDDDGQQYLVQDI